MVRRSFLVLGDTIPHGSDMPAEGLVDGRKAPAPSGVAPVIGVPGSAADGAQLVQELIQGAAARSSVSSCQAPDRMRSAACLRMKTPCARHEPGDVRHARLIRKGVGRRDVHDQDPGRGGGME